MYLFRLIHFAGVALLVLMLVGAMVARAQAPAPQEVAADAFWQQLDEQYCYDGDALGAQWDRRNNEVRFALWAPSAGVASVEIFDIANGNKSLGSGPQPLERDVDTGVWSLILPGAALGLTSFEGIGYRFIVDGRPALDPYARSMAVTSDPVGIGAIVDPGMTRVSGYARIPAYQRRTDAVIYELSVRDFTSDPTLEPALGGAPFGTFDALRTRLDYVAALGVTHIQLMPVMAWYYGDELAAREREDEWTPKDNNYNWGYDPHSWFALDGSYSANPQNPQARIDEFKQLVEAIHQRGMGVILDVVYNHHPVHDILDAIEPGYYYRGRNDSHAGIDIASERCMARKLIVDSLEYWSREFRVDGFRFDLMGLIDARTIREAHARLAQLNPKVLMIGEGWRMYQGPTLQMADQDWVLAQNFAAVFSDDFRDIIKSGFSDEGAPRFVSGGREPVASVLFNLRAEPMKNMRADDPGDVVQYVAAHDNLTLHDVIATALGVDPDRPTAETEIQRRIRLANTLLLTAQGIAFVHSGQEYGRSKRWRGEEPSPEATTNAAGASFVHNSYDSPDIVNWFDWAAVSGNRESARTTLYTAGLIALRRRTDAFRLGTPESIYRHVQKVETPDISLVDNAVAWQARNSDGSRLMVIVNADSRERVFRLQDDTRDVEVLVDGQRAGSVALSQPVDVRLEQRAVRLAPLTATVLRFPR